MKIVLIGENISVHIQKWIAAISEFKEIDLHVITFNNGIIFPNVTYHFLKKFTGTKLDYFLNAFIVRSYIKKIKPDLLHAHYASSYGFLADFSGFHPYIITGWGADIFDSPKNIIIKKIIIHAFKNADSLSVLSEITKVEMNKLTDKYVHLIPFGVDINKFAPNKSGKSSDVIKIGTIRTLAEKYGVEYLIRAFSILSKKYNNIYLEIVGDGPLKSYLEKLCIELGIEKNVKFYGYINQNDSFEEYINILSSFDIFAILSILDSETFGVAAVEASSCCIPVVATSVGGLTEVIIPNKTGIIVAPKNVEETVIALNNLISDKNLRLELGKNGRKNVEENYNWSRNIQQMIDLYKQTIDLYKK